MQSSKFDSIRQFEKRIKDVTIYVLDYVSFIHLWFFFQFRLVSFSVQFSSVVQSDSLQFHELQHARPPCPSPTPGVHPNPCPQSRWCHPAISSSGIPFSSCPQSFPASGSFQMRQFRIGGQRIGFSFSICPSNEYSGLISFRTDWFDLLAVQGIREILKRF